MKILFKARSLAFDRRTFNTNSTMVVAGKSLTRSPLKMRRERREKASGTEIILAVEASTEATASVVAMGWIRPSATTRTRANR